MIAQNSVAAATAVLGYDMMTGVSVKAASFPRRLEAVGLRGSAAAGDAAVRIMIGQTEVAVLYNDTTGFVNRDAMFRVGIGVPKDAEVKAYVTDAPATNPLNIALDFTDFGMMGV